MITCSRGHSYANTAKHCPACGELNFVLRPNAIPAPLGPFLLHRVPKTLRIRFKDACHAQGKLMREVVMDFMEAYAKGAGYGREVVPRNGPEAFYYGPPGMKPPPDAHGPRGGPREVGWGDDPRGPLGLPPRAPKPR